MSACKECSVAESQRHLCQPYFCTTRDVEHSRAHPAVVDTTGAGASCEVTALWERPAIRGATTTVFESGPKRRKKGGKHSRAVVK